MDRRTWLQHAIGGAYVMTGLGLTSCTASAAKKAHETTPSQTEGPFYPVSKPTDSDWNLIKHGEAESLALGEPLLLAGRVLNQAGAPLPGVTVEIWQVDGQGLYNHPDAPGHEKFDKGFQGFGATATDKDGQYQFLTLVPAMYPGRPPHIHVKIKRAARELLTTQLYIKDHPENGRDGLLAAIFFRGQDQLLMDLQAGTIGDGLTGFQTSFDFVVDA